MNILLVPTVKTRLETRRDSAKTVKTRVREARRDGGGFVSHKQQGFNADVVTQSIWMCRVKVNDFPRCGGSNQ